MASVGAVRSTPDPRTRPVTAGSAAPGTRPAVFALDLSGPPVDGDLDLLDDVEAARARRLFHESDRDRLIVRRALTRRLLADALACDAGRIAFTTGPCGRPHVASPATDVEFSLSSSAGLGLLAIGRGPLGIDVEQIRPHPASAGAAAHFLTDAELVHWTALPTAERVVAFFSSWTRKEAVAKSCGLGLGGLPPREHDLGFAEIDGLTTFVPAPGFVAAIAVRVAVPDRVVLTTARSEE